MLWIEMSRDPSPDDEWGLGRSLWSPTARRNGASWSFWDNLLRVEEGDVILHLVGDDDPFFSAHSVADSDGYVTRSQPPNNGYDYADTFHRVHLEDFMLLEEELPIEDFFDRYREEIVNYYEANKRLPRKEKRSILPVVQDERLQCLNGAYLTEVEGRLRELILTYLSEGHGSGLRSQSRRSSKEDSDQFPTTVQTDSRTQPAEQRIGQKEFSDDIKENWDDQCCFPGCGVDDRAFLVGAHIARWADNPDLRGNRENGLCLCLMHDKAFEHGLFTLTSDNEVWTTEDRVSGVRWAEKQIWPRVGESIDEAMVMPGDEPLLRHWIRINLNPLRTLAG